MRGSKERAAERLLRQARDRHRGRVASAQAQLARASQQFGVAAMVRATETRASTLRYHLSKLENPHFRTGRSAFATRIRAKCVGLVLFLFIFVLTFFVTHSHVADGGVSDGASSLLPNSFRSAQLYGVK
jgi:hypothetical protein